MQTQTANQIREGQRVQMTSYGTTKTGTVVRVQRSACVVIWDAYTDNGTPIPAKKRVEFMQSLSLFAD